MATIALWFSTLHTTRFFSTTTTVSITKPPSLTSLILPLSNAITLPHRAKVLGSEEEAVKKVYNVLCERYFGFGCEIDEEASNKLKGLPGVLFVLPDSYVDPEYKDYGDKLQSGSNIALPPPLVASSSSRRDVLVSVGTALVTMTLSPLMVRAQEKLAEKEEDDGKGIISSIESLFDPNEKTKSGKVLPKAYLKSAREVVKTLRESLNEASDNNAKFRRNADAAKESIREYLGTWRGQHSVVQEESYVMLEKAIRSLANFYSRAGPTTPLSEEVKSEILDYLNTAEQFL